MNALPEIVEAKSVVRIAVSVIVALLIKETSNE